MQHWEYAALLIREVRGADRSHRLAYVLVTESDVTELAPCPDPKDARDAHVIASQGLIAALNMAGDEGWSPDVVSGAWHRPPAADVHQAVLLRRERAAT